MGVQQKEPFFSMVSSALSVLPLSFGLSSDAYFLPVAAVIVLRLCEALFIGLFCGVEGFSVGYAVYGWLERVLDS